MFLGDIMVCENFVVGSEKRSEWRILRLLGVADNLKEDVDVWKGSESSRRSVLPTQMFLPWSLKGGNSSMADESGIRRVVILVLTRFRSVVQTVAVSMAETAFARSCIS